MNTDDKRFSTVIDNDELVAKVLTELDVRDLKDKGDIEVAVGKGDMVLAKNKGDIEVKADEGKIMLSGEVDSNETKREVEEAAFFVMEVLSVDNQLKVRA